MPSKTENPLASPRAYRVLPSRRHLVGAAASFAGLVALLVLVGLPTASAGHGPDFSVADAGIVEGDSGTKTLEFAFTASFAPGSNIRGDVALSPGTASEAIDYTNVAVTNVVLIPAGSTTATFFVTIIGDTMDEADETFTLTVSNLQGAHGTDLVAIGTIQDDDLPRVSIEAIDSTVGESGTDTTGTFRISVASQDPGRVDLPIVHVLGGSAKHEGDPAADYVLTPALPVTVLAAETYKDITVTAVDDDRDEPIETLRITLVAQPGVYALGSPFEGAVTIADDDPQPVIQVDGPGVGIVEDDVGNPEIVFTVKLVKSTEDSSPRPSDFIVLVDYTTMDFTAKKGVDYQAVSGKLQFDPGQTMKTVTVKIIPDQIHEPGGEKLKLVLSNPQHAALPVTEAQATILDNDETAVSVSGETTIVEGDTGTKDVVFTVSLTRPSSVPISVTANTKPGTATAPGDFTAIVDKVLTFAPGETSKNVIAKVAGDLTGEDDETFTLEIGNISPAGAAPAGVQAGTMVAAVTIRDDDTNSLKIADVTVAEGKYNTTTDMSFVITRSEGTGDLALKYTVASGSALQGYDFVDPMGTVYPREIIIPAGENTATFTIKVIGDNAPEGDETFTITLSGQSTGYLKKAVATGKITDDDPFPPSDQDNDGILDGADNCPVNANPDQKDSDSDGIGDACDPHPFDGGEADSDGDGVKDKDDKFPEDPSEWVDTDGDGIGDNADTDDDGDTIPDATDNCPLIANKDQKDLDKDGKGDACDDDRDGDGVPDAKDAFPDDASESKDSDKDGVGDNADLDDDNDGLLDTDEAKHGTNPLKADTDGDGIPDGKEVDIGSDPLNAADPALQPTKVDAVQAGTGVSISWKGGGHPDVREYWVFRDNGGSVSLVARAPASALDSYTVADANYPGGRVTYYVQATDSVATPRLDRFEAAASLPVQFSVDDVVVPCPDADKDGLCDDEELLLGTDPNNPDSDGDGMSDSAEVDAGTDPLDKLDGPAVVQSSNEGMSKGLKLGLIIGGGLLFVGIAVGAVLLLRRK